MENFNVTENTSKMYGKEASSSVFSEAFRDAQGNGNSLYSTEKDSFKKPLPQGFPELTIEGQLGNAGPSKDFAGTKKWIDESLGNKKNVYGDKKEGMERLDKKEDADGRLGKKDDADTRLKKKEELDERQKKKEEAELKQKKEDELILRKKEMVLNEGLKFDKTKIPGKDGGTKNSVSTESSGKVPDLEGGPKDKPAPAGQATRDRASERHERTHSPDKVAHDGGPKDQLDHHI